MNIEKILETITKKHGKNSVLIIYMDGSCNIVNGTTNELLDEDTGADTLEELEKKYNQ